MRRLILMMGVLATAAAVNVARAQEAAGSKSPVTLAIRVARPRLLYGQPLQLAVETANRSQEAPWSRLIWQGPHRTVHLELKSERGNDVAYRLEWVGRMSSLSGCRHTVRLGAEGEFARGRYLKPGKYRLWVRVDSARNPADPKRRVGKLASNIAEVTILDSTPEGRSKLASDDLRRSATPHLRDLDAADFQKREAATTALTAMGAGILPLLEEALGSKSAEVRARASRILENLLKPLVELAADGGPWRRPNAYHRAMFIFGYLGEPAWKVIRERRLVKNIDVLRARAAMYGPADPYRDLSSPDPLTVRKIMAQLADGNPAVRIGAIRSLSRTPNTEILKALVSKLADPFFFHEGGRGMPGTPVRSFAVAKAARDSLVCQGTCVIGMLIEFAKGKAAQQWPRRRALHVLGKLGPDPRTMEYMSELVASTKYDDHYYAVETLESLGLAGAPLLFKVARNAGAKYIPRRIALEALGKVGGAGKLKPVPAEMTSFLLRMLRQEFRVKMARHEKDGLVGAAAGTVGRLGLRVALPELKRIARDERINQNARYRAMRAILQLSERKGAERLLLELMNRNYHSGVRGRAMVMLAEIGCRTAIPAIIEALAGEGPDRLVRTQADTALRGFAKRPQGVGYKANASAEERAGEAAKWRSIFKDIE